MHKKCGVYKNVQEMCCVFTSKIFAQVSKDKDFKKCIEGSKTSKSQSILVVVELTRDANS